MEIISFVQGNKKNRRPRFFSALTFNKFEFNRNKRFQTLTYEPFTPGLKTFAPQRVKKSVNLKSIFKLIGGALTDFFEFLKINAKTVFISFVAAVFTVMVLFFAVKIVEYNINFTKSISTICLIESASERYSSAT